MQLKIAPQGGNLDGVNPDPARSRPIPGHYYYDPAIFEREKTAIFYRTWQYMGHISMLPQSGSFSRPDNRKKPMLSLAS